jgi:hypothetical protein
VLDYVSTLDQNVNRSIIVLYPPMGKLIAISVQKHPLIHPLPPPAKTCFAGIGSERIVYQSHLNRPQVIASPLANILVCFSE